MGFLSFFTPFGQATVSGGVLPGSDGARPQAAPTTPGSVSNPIIEPPAQHHPVEMTKVPGEPLSLLPHAQAKAEADAAAKGEFQVKAERNPMFTVSDMRHPGQTPDISHVNPDLLDAFGRTQKQVGQTLPIVSGFRGETTNRAAGGARHSQHLSGNAIDVDVSRLNQPQQIELIRAARKNGIQGIGVYASDSTKARSFHFDLGRRRAWGPDHTHNSVPSWAWSALNE